MTLSIDAINSMVDRILHVPRTFDPSTRLPLVVIDSKGLDELKTERWPVIIEAMIKRLPQCDYVLIFFASGAPNKPSWTWISKTYNMLGSNIKKRVKKVYIVHESWWIKTVTEMFRGIVSSKFRKKLVHLSSLSHLAQHIDITLINIPPHVYLHNLKLESAITVPKHIEPVFGESLVKNGQFSLPQLWIDVVNYLHITGPNTRGIFCKTEMSDMVYIMKDCYDRNQIIDIDDYGPLQAASLLKLFIYELPDPILHINNIPLPMESSVEYCVDVMTGLPYSSKVIILSFLDLLNLIIDNKNRTFQSPVTMANSVATCLIGKQSADKNHIEICTRFLTIVLDNWPMIAEELDKKKETKLKIDKNQYIHSALGPVSSVANSGSTVNSTVSSNLTPIGYPTRNASTPDLRQKHKSNEDLIDYKRSISEAGTSRIRGIETVKTKSDIRPTPPPPRMAKSIPELGVKVKVLQPSKVTNTDERINTIKNEPKQMQKQVTIRRGKIVAELAAFYEENSDTPLGMVNKERETWKNTKGIIDMDSNENVL